jgi:hypothetical protein
VQSPWFPRVVPNATFFKTVENGSKACRGARYYDGSFAAGFARPCRYKPSNTGRQYDVNLHFTFIFLFVDVRITILVQKIK